MTVAPLDSKAISADQLQGEGPNVRRYVAWVEQRPATHLFDTPGTGTGKPEGTGREEAGVTQLIPFDQETVIAAGNGIGNGRHGWY